MIAQIGLKRITYIWCALLIIWFCFSLASGVEARRQEKQQMPKQDANLNVNTSNKSNSSLTEDKPAKQQPKQPTEKEREEAQKRARFDVILTNAGSRRIEVIKVVREVTGLSLKNAKDLVESTPKPVKRSIPKEEAKSIRKKLTDVGASAEVTVAQPPSK